MNSNHRVNVVRINEIHPHTNADTLGLVMIGGYQVVVKKDNYKVGDLAIYIQPDSVVPQTKQFDFLWADKEFPDGVVPEKYRRITVRRFRKEWSEGLLLPLTDFPELYNRTAFATFTKAEGDDVAEILGITHYEEPEPLDIYGEAPKQERGWPRSLKGWWYRLLYYLGIRERNGGGTWEKAPKNAPPVFDVEGFKNYNTTLQPGELVAALEKIHGSNGRYMFDGKRMWAGSKKLWKSEKSNCIWRRALKEEPKIEEFCRSFPNRTLYVEVTPTQKIKKTGKPYDYGTNEAKPVRVFGYDVYDPETQTYWDKTKTIIALKSFDLCAPVLYMGPYDEATIKGLAEGQTTVDGATHIREGLVVTTATERYVPGLGRVQLKIKSLKFFESEGKV